MAAKKSSGEPQKIGNTRSLGRARRKTGSSKRDDPMSRQAGVFDEHLAIVLAKALNEWMARNPGRSVEDINITAILPEALDEFIWRHLEDSE